LERGHAFGRKATRSLSAAVFLHTALVILLWVQEAHFPVMSVGNAIFTWMWLFGLLYWILELRLKEQAFGMFIVSLLVTFLFISNLLPHQHGPLPPYFRDKWVQIHIFLMLVAYTAFAIGFIASVMYLMLFKELKEKNLKFFYSRLPALELLDKMGMESLTLGFVFLTIGILVSLSIGSEYLPHAWYLDLKVLSVFVTWIIYAAYLGSRWFLNSSPRKSAYFPIVGFGWILISFFIVSTLVSNVHAY
jgi:ABC-type transport system involved in cytochrome c biogenesis permease subunit